MTISGHDTVRFQDLQEGALKFVQWKNTRRCGKSAGRHVFSGNKFNVRCRKTEMRIGTEGLSLARI
jgi:hypothetical protein